jgi:hypothetical protein
MMVQEEMERMARIELATFTLATWCSTAELHPQIQGAIWVVYTARSINSAALKVPS